MKAMILAAGLGTRLRPLTDHRPKALVELNGRTLLEITISQLMQFGVKEIIVNVHHFAQQVVDFLNSKNNFGIRIEVSREDELLLDTGGGLKKAAWFFLGSDEPFLLHNADVLSNIDLGRLLQAHRDNGALATLAVQKRSSSRQLLFDNEMKLCGRRIGRQGQPQIVGKSGVLQELAFSGIHAISPRMLDMITEDGVFSIIDTYLRLAEQGKNIAGFRADEYYWRDLGREDELKKAEDDLRKGTV